jgi:mannitol/fructose-specific phosphotransferase system IIA component (Ntr-type)
MNLLDILSPEAIKVPLVATEKKGAIEELVDLLVESRSIKKPAALKEAVWQRELQRTTGIGEGLAIPHGKCNSTTELHLALGKPATPMEFGSVDKKPVQLIVLLASPPDRTSDHIQALGKISRLMANPEFREAAYAATDAMILFELFKDAEGA